MTSPDTATAYPHLFSKLRPRADELKNRIVHAAMSTRLQVQVR
jgi:2,4-dienoyl-CoA reductase-like NADH-dependent reductase (Old Yellow Enzyme family)